MENPADDLGAVRPAASHRPVATPRSEARERALHLLYETEVRDQTHREVLAAQVVTPDGYTETLVSGVGERLGDIDELISVTSHDWPLERMPAMDRAVLRLATYELVAQTSVPTAVVIDEAVELAKRYSTDDSGRFVNGVLAAIAPRVRPPQTC